MAICGGVNSILTPINNIVLSKVRMISKTGKSHTFSADADGYARGEGCGIVILKNFKKVHILNFLITVYKNYNGGYITYIDYGMPNSSGKCVILIKGWYKFNST
jgi:polyketide synthase PksN